MTAVMRHDALIWIASTLVSVAQEDPRTVGMVETVKTMFATGMERGDVTCAIATMLEAADSDPPAGEEGDR